MNKKTIGIILIVLGVLMLAVDLLIEPLNLGGPGFGWKQIVLLIAGFIAIGAGYVLGFLKGKS
ncbi:MAG: hypothetical protein CVU39_21125 [Chloroflexi bacterium HGW-Chloroflexi-10]|nr:MAG: hypothetical protein CVU39_21125 [Chloroflexi bacterium HGW-Chloroflexi-10]